MVNDNANAAGRENWSLEQDELGVIWLAIDCPGKSTNTLSSGVLEELSSAIDDVEREQATGLVVHSTKDSGFIVGADVSEFDALTDPLATANKVEIVHELFQRIEDLRCPSVAKIHGFCLGGGLELALACRFRVALDDHRTRLGFPEILLGIHPGFGGTVRSIERIGLPAAMDMMLTGRNVDARKALKLGLVDRAVPLRHLDKAVRKLLTAKSREKTRANIRDIADTRLARPAVALALRRQVAKRAAEQHYPAPYALIRLWQDYGGDRRAMFHQEALSIGRLFASATSKNLQRLFFLQERLKSFGRDVDFPAQHVHVVGAGTMGGDIAAWCAMRGLRVSLQDRDIKYVAPAIQRATDAYRKRIKDPYRRARIQDNLIVDLDGAGVSRADVIIEAIIEDLEAKQEIFKQLEEQAQPGALLATNTSSIPLEDIAGEMRDSSRLVGIHFFNPVARMQLIEIIRGNDTAAEYCERAAAFAVQIDRQPLPATSAPGFLINRILSPYLQEAMLMVDEGVSPVVIDEVATDFGMPMGPIELADTVGLDICLSVGEVLSAKLGGTAPEILQRKVDQGLLGRKNGAGFYEYKGKRVIRPEAIEPTSARSEIRDRMILRLVNESIACLREQVVADADLIDVGMVFGTGFAPFRGGPIHYVKNRGLGDSKLALEGLAGRLGERFSPDPGWALLAD